MKAPGSLSRRDMIAMLGTIPVAGVLQARTTESMESSFRYVGRDHSIEVLQRLAGRWNRVQRVASENPSFVLLDRSRQFLFAVNEVGEYGGLPAGSVESYAVDALSGHLQLLSREPLSLSATYPKHLAISPDRRYLIVAAYGGGSYNVLPIHTDGTLGGVSQIIKEIGCSSHPERQTSSHPHTVVFHPAGRFLLASDLGSDRLNVFAFSEGRMSRVSRVDVPTGSGPARMTLQDSGSTLFVEHELCPLKSHYRFCAVNGELTLLKTFA